MIGSHIQGHRAATALEQVWMASGPADGDSDEVELQGRGRNKVQGFVRASFRLRMQRRTVRLKDSSTTPLFTRHVPGWSSFPSPPDVRNRHWIFPFYTAQLGLSTILGTPLRQSKRCMTTIEPTLGAKSTSCHRLHPSSFDSAVSFA